MEEGSLRCDANVSVMLKDANEFGKKVEIKNMNSLRHIQRAIDVEIERQIGELETGNTILSETRMFDIATGKTYGMRTKEELNDYRYFPDPDLSPVIISEQWLGAIAATIPPMPYELQKKFTQVYGLPAYDAHVLTDSKELAMYFEEVCKLTNNYKAASNWMMGPVKSYLNEFGKEVSDFPLKPPILVTLLELVEQGKVSFSVASQQVFTALLQDPSLPVVQVAQELNVWQESNVDSLLVVIEEVLRTYPDKVQEYKKGKKGLLAMFMGEVMKRSKGKADPKKTSALLEEKLNIL
jgi:aspartyl-tRNA(Asn)/glutamyl-tRNA(Gln) amidotransferase subunit B